MLSLRGHTIQPQIVHNKLSSWALATLAIMIIAPGLPQHLRSQEPRLAQTFAQRMVNDVTAKHRPEVTYLGLHGVTPQSPKSVIFAATDARKIGKESSCGDLDVMEKGVPVLEMKGKTTTILERLRDSSGNAIGLIAVAFNFGDGEESQAAKLAKEIGDELARQIPSKGKLFETAK